MQKRNFAIKDDKGKTIFRKYNNSYLAWVPFTVLNGKSKPKARCQLSFFRCVAPKKVWEPLF